MTSEINPFEVLYQSYPKEATSGTPGSLTHKGMTNPQTDTTFDIIRRTAIDSITPDILKDSGCCPKTGYVVRTGEPAPKINLAESVFQIQDQHLVARCIILDGFETKALPLPRTYDETYVDSAAIDALPGFRYPKCMSADIVRGSFVKVQFTGGSLDRGIIIGVHEIPPTTLDTNPKGQRSREAFGAGGAPEFLGQAAGSLALVPKARPAFAAANITYRNAGFRALGEHQVSPASTYAIPESYFYPSRFRSSLARGINSLDDAVKLRFARGVKKFIVQYFGTGLDIKMNLGFRSVRSENYPWRL